VDKRVGSSMWRMMNGEQGFTYIALLIFIAIMSVGLLATGEVWSTSMRREKEQELLFAGDQIRNAISMYYSHTPAQAGYYPTSLEDLLKDPRYPATRRYLRKIYPDPITNSTDWELVKGPNGEIFGVHSISDDMPLKKSNFNFADRGFEGKTKYSDWVFMISARYMAAPTSVKRQ
jgi:type II secretory pathway pseudopilin PulG